MMVYLLHNAGLALGKRDVSSRLVRDEFDVYLSAFSSRLVVVVVIVVSRASGVADARADARSTLRATSSTTGFTRRKECRTHS